MTDADHPARHAPLTEEQARKLLCDCCLPTLHPYRHHEDDRLVDLLLALDAAAFSRGRAEGALAQAHAELSCEEDLCRERDEAREVAATLARLVWRAVTLDDEATQPERAALDKALAWAKEKP